MTINLEGLTDGQAIEQMKARGVSEETSKKLLKIWREEFSNESGYKCEVCNKFISENEGVTTLSGLWVCDNDTCRTLDISNDAVEKERVNND